MRASTNRFSFNSKGFVWLPLLKTLPQQRGWVGGTRWSHEYCSDGQVPWGELRSRLSINSHPRRAGSARSSLRCASPRRCCVKAFVDSCIYLWLYCAESPQSHQPDLPDIHPQIFENGKPLFTCAICFSVSEPLVSLLVLGQQGKCNETALSFDFLLQGQGDSWGKH